MQVKGQKGLNPDSVERGGTEMIFLLEIKSFRTHRLAQNDLGIEKCGWKSDINQKYHDLVGLFRIVLVMCSYIFVVVLH